MITSSSQVSSAATACAFCQDNSSVTAAGSLPVTFSSASDTLTSKGKPMSSISSLLLGDWDASMIRFILFEIVDTTEEYLLVLVSIDIQRNTIPTPF